MILLLQPVQMKAIKSKKTQSSRLFIVCLFLSRFGAVNRGSDHAYYQGKNYLLWVQLITAPDLNLTLTLKIVITVRTY